MLLGVGLLPSVGALSRIGALQGRVVFYFLKFKGKLEGAQCSRSSRYFEE